MLRRRKTLVHKVGQPPGTLIHVGDTRADKANISVLTFSGDGLTEVEDADMEALSALVAQPGITWINVRGLNSSVVEQIGQQFNIHPLVLEDILNTDQRPKLDDYGDYLGVIIKSLAMSPEASSFAVEQVSFILGKNYVISFQESLPGDKDIFAGLMDRIKCGNGRIRRQGADYLLYALLDNVVDHYFLVLEHLGDRIETVESLIVEQPRPELLRDLHGLKHDMLYLRKSVWPLRELVSSLERGESAHIEDATLIYLRDVYDHTIQVIETVEIYRDMLSGMMDIYLSSISNRMSEVMKMLTIISTIFIPLTFIAGVYGMNFEHMPELKWEYGYLLVLSVMAGLSLFMLRYFRKKRWL